MILCKSFDYSLFYKIISEIGNKSHQRFVDTLNDAETFMFNDIFNHLESYWFDSFRSSLIWFCNKLVGGNPENTTSLSFIMSTVGSGLGIHDDIIDKTRFKGLRDTVFELFGLEIALITGDLLIIKGLISLPFLFDEFNEDRAVLLLKVFKDYFTEMAVAERLEIDANKQIDLDLESYHQMLWKLGSDVKTCAVLGAISGNANNEQIDSLSYFGNSIGYINRLNDEINDVMNIKGNLRMRIKNESIPLALLYAVKQSKYNYNIMNKILSKNETDEKDIEKILDICYEINAFKYIQEEIDKTYYEAKKRIEIFPESTAKKMLTWCLYYITNKKEILSKRTRGQLSPIRSGRSTNYGRKSIRK